MLGEPTPNDADRDQWSYAFEKGTEKTTGGSGYADIWKRDFFAWEYKGKRKNLSEAYQQLLQYREALENPPLLIVSDLHNFEVHTNFNSTAKEIHRFTLEDLRDHPARPLDVLRAAMSDPERLHPLRTPDEVTQDGAARFAELAESLQAQGYDAERVARFLNRVLFCLFAEDIGLLPNEVFGRLVRETGKQPKIFSRQLADLFHQMRTEGVTYFGTDPIDWFNGGLFGDDDSLDLTADEVEIVGEALELDWSQIEPAILGTLFERELNPVKRGRLGVHYTDRESIERIVEPVVLVPLRREFEVMKLDVDQMLARPGNWRLRKRVDTNPLKHAEAFLERLRAITVLDPACGSGNFLYVTLLKVKDLEKEVGLWLSQRLGIAIPFPRVDPAIVRGIELDPYAAELARVSVWIGHIQWMLQNGFDYRRDPVLQPLESVELRDAIVSHAEDGSPIQAEWPESEFVVGNPPFLGGKRLRTTLGDDYVNEMFAAWDGMVPREADLVCYWHEKVRSEIEQGRVKRAGLLATNSIRGGPNRRVLDRVKASGDIFAAWDDEPWVVDGANVRVAIVGQDDGSELDRRLDGRTVAAIHSDLSEGGGTKADLTGAQRLAENAGVAFMGDSKGGAI